MWATRLWENSVDSFLSLVDSLHHRNFFLAGCDGRYLDGILTHLPTPSFQSRVTRKYRSANSDKSGLCQVAQLLKVGRSKGRWKKCLIKIPWHDQHELIRTTKSSLLHCMNSYKKCFKWEICEWENEFLNIEIKKRRAHSSKKTNFEQSQQKIYDAKEYAYFCGTTLRFHIINNEKRTFGRLHELNMVNNKPLMYRPKEPGKRTIDGQQIIKS